MHGKIQVKNLHQRSPYAMKFEDRSQEETEGQQRCARSKAWNLARHINKLKENDKATFYSPAEEWVLPAASTNEPEERELVDSGASMHMVSKRDLNSAELETRRTSRSPTTVMTTARFKQEKKQQKMSKHWTYSLQLCFLTKLPQFLLSGSSARIMGIPAAGPAVKNRAIRSPWFIHEFLYNAHTYFVFFFITGFCI